MLYKTATLLTILGTALFAPTAANAAIFKCVGANGEISYNQTPCAVEEQTAKVLSSGSKNKNSHDCRIANNFARRTAMGMRTGMTSGDVFDSYGGIDAIPRTAVGVINYVYTHKENHDVGSQRIAALSAARCSAGSYGPVTCDDFPYGFVSELGGCDAASKSTLTETQPAAAETPEDMPETGQNGATQALGTRTADTQRRATMDCRKNIQSQLNDLFIQMRSGQSAGSQNNLQDQKNDLRAQLSTC